MQFFLTKGLTETAPSWSDIQQGYAWVYRAAHLLTNDEKQKAAQVRQSYEALLTEMEQAPASSEALTTMLSTFCKVTTSYWPGLFHCYDHADLPRTNNELEQYLVQPATMNGGRQGENARHQGWLYAEPFGLLPPSLHICILLAVQSFALLIQRDGGPCGTNLITVMRHGAGSIVSVSHLKATLRLWKRSSSRKDCRHRKELLGHFKNNGREWQAKGEDIQVNVYDFVSLTDGKAIPYGSTIWSTRGALSMSASIMIPPSLPLRVSEGGGSTVAERSMPTRRSC
jgi:hypothetical protein